MVALLEANSLTKDFGGLVAVKNVSFTIEEGEIVGLIGPNGAGKSTLFNLITSTYRPTSGKILFDGKDITHLKPHDIVKLGISRTFQSVRPFLTYTVENNIRVGALFGHAKKIDVEKKIKDVLEITGLETKRESLVSSLPIEERKLVEVARALASSPRLLLLDEPMAGLNPAEIMRFVDLVYKVNQMGVTVLVVEHVMKAITRLSRRVIVIHSGEKLAEGTPQEVLANESVVSLYLGDQYAKS